MKKFWRKNKKKVFILCVVFISLCTGFFLFIHATKSASADEASVGSTQNADSNGLQESILEQLGQLDLSELQTYVNSLDGYSKANVVERLLS